MRGSGGSATPLLPGAPSAMPSAAPSDGMPADAAVYACSAGLRPQAGAGVVGGAPSHGALPALEELECALPGPSIGLHTKLGPLQHRQLLSCSAEAAVLPVGSVCVAPPRAARSSLHGGGAAAGRPAAAEARSLVHSAFQDHTTGMLPAQLLDTPTQLMRAQHHGQPMLPELPVPSCQHLPVMLRQPARSPTARLVGLHAHDAPGLLSVGGQGPAVVAAAGWERGEGSGTALQRHHAAGRGRPTTEPTAGRLHGGVEEADEGMRMKCMLAQARAVGPDGLRLGGRSSGGCGSSSAQRGCASSQAAGASMDCFVTDAHVNQHQRQPADSPSQPMQLPPGLPPGASLVSVTPELRAGLVGVLYTIPGSDSVSAALWQYLLPAAGDIATSAAMGPDAMTVFPGTGRGVADSRSVCLLGRFSSAADAEQMCATAAGLLAGRRRDAEAPSRTAPLLPAGAAPKPPLTGGGSHVAVRRAERDVLGAAAGSIAAGGGTGSAGLGGAAAPAGMSALPLGLPADGPHAAQIPLPSSGAPLTAHGSMRLQSIDSAASAPQRPYLSLLPLVGSSRVVASELQDAVSPKPVAQQPQFALVAAPNAGVAAPAAVLDGVTAPGPRLLLRPLLPGGPPHKRPRLEAVAAPSQQDYDGGSRGAVDGCVLVGTTSEQPQLDAHVAGSADAGGRTAEKHQWALPLTAQEPDMEGDSQSRWTSAQGGAAADRPTVAMALQHAAAAIAAPAVASASSDPSADRLLLGPHSTATGAAHALEACGLLPLAGAPAAVYGSGGAVGAAPGRAAPAGSGRLELPAAHAALRHQHHRVVQLGAQAAVRPRAAGAARGSQHGAAGDGRSVKECMRAEGPIATITPCVGVGGDSDRAPSSIRELPAALPGTAAFVASARRTIVGISLPSSASSPRSHSEARWLDVPTGEDAGSITPLRRHSQRTENLGAPSAILTHAPAQRPHSLSVMPQVAPSQPQGHSPAALDLRQWRPAPTSVPSIARQNSSLAHGMSGAGTSQGQSSHEVSGAGGGVPSGDPQRAAVPWTLDLSAAGQRSSSPPVELRWRPPP